jgi:hypothetical protein
MMTQKRLSNLVFSGALVDVKELLIGVAAMVTFAIAIVYLRQHRSSP